MHAAASLGLGYIIGSLSPATLMGKRKHTDLKQEGTGNLGATNTMLVLGAGAGVLVMVLDLLKSFLSGKLAEFLFPGLSVAGMLGCVGSMVGHCFPVFHRFRGGKGLATFGGLVIYCGLKYVPIVLFAGLAMMLLFDSTVAFPLTVSALLPVLLLLFGEEPAKVWTAVLAGVILVAMHIGNLKKAIAGDAVTHVRGYLKEKLFHKN